MAVGKTHTATRAHAEMIRQAARLQAPQVLNDDPFGETEFDRIRSVMEENRALFEHNRQQELAQIQAEIQYPTAVGTGVYTSRTLEFQRQLEALNESALRAVRPLEAIGRVLPSVVNGRLYATRINVNDIIESDGGDLLRVLSVAGNTLVVESAPPLEEMAGVFIHRPVPEQMRSQELRNMTATGAQMLANQTINRFRETVEEAKRYDEQQRRNEVEEVPRDTKRRVRAA